MNVHCVDSSLVSCKFYSLMIVFSSPAGNPYEFPLAPNMELRQRDGYPVPLFEALRPNTGAALSRGVRQRLVRGAAVLERSN